MYHTQADWDELYRRRETPWEKGSRTRAWSTSWLRTGR